MENSLGGRLKNIQKLRVLCVEEFENSDKICVACHKEPAHPVYSGYCENCFVDKRLVKAYGSKPKDRSIENMPYNVDGGLDLAGGHESFT